MLVIVCRDDSYCHLGYGQDAHSHTNKKKPWQENIYGVEITLPMSIIRIPDSKKGDVEE